MFTDILLYSNLFLALFVNGAISFPSSQIIYLSLGYFLAEKSYLYVLNVILIASLGNTFGNLSLYYLFFYKNSNLKTKIEDFLKIDKSKVEVFLNKAQKHSYFWVFVGKLIPSVKVFIPVIAAMLKIKPFHAFGLFFLGSFIWGCLLTSIGFYFGQTVNLKVFYLCLLLLYTALFFIFKLKKAI